MRSVGALAGAQRGGGTVRGVMLGGSEEKGTYGAQGRSAGAWCGCTVQERRAGARSAARPVPVPASQQRVGPWVCRPMGV